MKHPVSAKKASQERQLQNNPNLEHYTTNLLHLVCRRLNLGRESDGQEDDEAETNGVHDGRLSIPHFVRGQILRTREGKKLEQKHHQHKRKHTLTLTTRSLTAEFSQKNNVYVNTYSKGRSRFKAKRTIPMSMPRMIKKNMLRSNEKDCVRSARGKK